MDRQQLLYNLLQTQETMRRLGETSLQLHHEFHSDILPVFRLRLRHKLALTTLSALAGWYAAGRLPGAYDAHRLLFWLGPLWPLYYRPLFRLGNALWKGTSRRVSRTRYEELNRTVAELGMALQTHTAVPPGYLQPEPVAAFIRYVSEYRAYTIQECVAWYELERQQRHTPAPPETIRERLERLAAHETRKRRKRLEEAGAPRGSSEETAD